MSEVSLDATKIVPNTTKYKQKLHQEQKETSDIIFAFKLLCQLERYDLCTYCTYIPTIFYEYRLTMGQNI